MCILYSSSVHICFPAVDGEVPMNEYWYIYHYALSHRHFLHFLSQLQD